MRNEFLHRRLPRRIVLVATLLIAGPLAFIPSPTSAEGLFDFFLGGLSKLQAHLAVPPQASSLADPFGNNQQTPALPPQPMMAGSGPAYCVRSCDGKYFPLMRAAASPIQMCQAFCPASSTKVFFGASIDTAYSASGERYADSANAFAYRKALRADCTCNGRNPAGLAPVDVTLDPSLREGDVVATSDGLVAYSGVRVGNDQTADFTPVASYPGLTADLRARLGEMKVAPARADMVAGDAAPAAPATPVLPAIPVSPKAKRADLN